MNRGLFRFTSAVVLAGSVLLGAVSAHESRTVGDLYDLAVGWREEPAYAGMLNGVDVYISLHAASGHDHNHSDSTPQADHSHGEAMSLDEQRAALEALDIRLMADVTFGDQTITQALEPNYETFVAFGDTGYLNYVTTLIPSLPGDYVMRIHGTIDGIAVDETFDSADGMFSTVEPVADLQFPAIGTDADRIAALEARIAELEAAIEELRGQ